MTIEETDRRRKRKRKEQGCGKLDRGDRKKEGSMKKENGKGREAITKEMRGHTDRKGMLDAAVRKASKSGRDE